MSDFDTAQLGDICDINPDTLADSSDASARYRYIDLSSVNEQKIDFAIESRLFSALPSRARRKVRYGDVLLGTVRPNLKNFAFVSSSDKDLVASTGFAVLRSKEKLSNAEFIFHLINSDIVGSQLNALVTGSNYPAVNAGQVGELLVPMPPLPEQKKIAEILSGIDRELDASRENLSRTNLLRTSLLKSMMQDAEEDSMQQALGSIVEVINGRAYKLTEWENEGTPVIRLQNLTKKGGNFYYSNLQLPKKQYCEKGDLLFMWSASFGPHIWWGERAIFHYHIWKMVPKGNALLKDYLYLFLQHKTEQWKSQGAGMAMIHLTKEGIEKEIIPLPQVATQERIVNAIRSIDAQIEAEKTKANKIISLKVAISQDLLSGCKRVSV